MLSGRFGNFVPRISGLDIRALWRSRIRVVVTVGILISMLLNFGTVLNFVLPNVWSICGWSLVRGPALSSEMVLGCQRRRGALSCCRFVVGASEIIWWTSRRELLVWN